MQVPHPHIDMHIDIAGGTAHGGTAVEAVMEAVRTRPTAHIPYKGPHDTGRALLTYQGLTQTGMHSNSHTE